MTLGQLHKATLKLIKKVRKHLFTPQAVSELNDNEFDEKVLSELEGTIQADMAVLKMQNVATNQRTGGWCPDVCPITLLSFFMWIEHPSGELVPTYGGPFDSYTMPKPSLINSGNDRKDIEYTRERFDHDQGCWIDGCEVVQERVVTEEELIDLNAWGDS